VFVCGESGSGKSTVGKTLSNEHGWAHFDGDAWFYGLDPVEQAGVTPTPE
jgi:adenylate kinase family enzyme